MSLIIPVGFGQAVYQLRLTGDNEPMVVTMGHDLAEVVGGDYQTIVDRLHTSFGLEMMPRVASNYTFEATFLYVGQDGGPPAVFESTEDPVTGGMAGNPLPQNSAMLFRKRTSAAGRRGRGRLYLPGIQEQDVSALGVIDGAVVTALQARADAWMDWLTGVEVGSVAYPPVILHRTEGIGVEPPPTPVTALVIDPVIATQRRRLRR